MLKQKTTTWPMSRKGFTLIELLVVVAVLALLASIVTSNLGGAREGARISNALAFQSQTHSLLGSDLVGWWNFNEGDARDISGYDNHGTVVGATHVDGVPGTGGSALSFNGVGDYVDVGNSSSLRFVDEITIGAWINPKLLSKTQGIISLPYIYNWWFAIHSNNRLLFGHRDIDSNISNKYSNSTVSLDTWQYVALVYNDSEKKVHFYINGELDGEGTFNKEMRTTNWGPCYIGTYTPTNHLFNGLIADVRIYSRALTASEVQTLYAQTKDNYLANE